MAASGVSAAQHDFSVFERLQFGDVSATFLSSLIARNKSFLKDLKSDIKDAKFLLKNALPGVLIKIEIETFFENGINGYFMRTQTGHICVLIEREGVYYDINTKPIMPWDIRSAFEERIHSLCENTPPHLVPYLTVLKDPKRGPVEYASKLYQIGTLINDTVLLLKTDEKTYLRLDSVVPEYYQNYFGTIINQKGIEFLNKIQAAQLALIQNSATYDKEPISKTISFRDLANIYTRILFLDDISKRLNQGFPFRIEKNEEFSKTLYIQPDHEGNFSLILGTSKTKFGAKVQVNDRRVNCGVTSSVNACFRIDVYPPEEYTQKTPNDGVSLIRLMYDSWVSQNYGDPNYFNRSFLGVMYHNKRTKRHLFSKKASHGELTDLFLEDSKNDDEDNQLIEDILIAVDKGHQDGVIFQDIKIENVLLKMVSEKKRAYLTDFMDAFISEDISPKSLMITGGSPRYESPEIAFAYQAETSYYHKAFYAKDKVDCSFGIHWLKKLQEQQLFQGDANEYSKPHQANDMWAVGMVIFLILKGKYVDPKKQKHQDFIDNHPLLKGLLNPIRAERFTSTQALEKFREMQLCEQTKKLAM